MKQIIGTAAIALCLTVGFGIYTSRVLSDVKKEVAGYADAAQEQIQMLRETFTDALTTVQEFLPSLTASGGNAQTTKEATRLVCIVCDEKGEFLYETEELLPEYLVNLSREQIAGFYEGIYSDFKENSEQTAVKQAQLISFSPEAVVVKKFCEAKKDTFFVSMKDGMVVVYYEDRKTIYEATDISVSELEEKEQEELAEGFLVEGIEELFSVLESFTS